MLKRVRQAVCLLLMLTCAPAWATPTETYDWVIHNGRVIDPESGLDAVRDIGLRGETIAVVSETPLEGESVIDAKGMIVAPGFVDIHSHAMSIDGQRYQLFDGVTTALELEAGAYPGASMTELYADGALIHYGASLGYLWLRQWMLSGQYQPSLVHAPQTSVDRPQQWPAQNPKAVFAQHLDDSQLQSIRQQMIKAINTGDTIGIGLPFDYIKNALTPEESLAVFQTAAATGQVVFIHARRTPPGSLEGLQEIIDLASQAGAGVHFCHINSNALQGIGAYLSTVEAALGRGVDISIEAYPWEAGSTQIGAASLRGDWHSLYGMYYGDIIWAATGEVLTPETFAQRQADTPHGTVILFSNDMASVDLAILHPLTMIASDAMPGSGPEGRAHPRGRGTFTRVLRRYVRESGKLDWPQALAKMTIAPANRLATMAPAFARKGRLQAGMDADIVVFNPETVAEHTSYNDPNQLATGMKYVFVSGQLAISNGRQVDGIRAGQWLQARQSKLSN